MVKIIGAIMVIGAGTFLGFVRGEKLNRRCRVLKLWLRIIALFDTEIFYQTSRLPEVLRKAALIIDAPEMKRAFYRVVATVEYGADEDLAEAWAGMVRETNGDILDAHDCQILFELGQYLGFTCREDQHAKLQACQIRLENNLRIAERDRQKKLGLYRYLGFAGGAIIVLWLL